MLGSLVFNAVVLLVALLVLNQASRWTIDNSANLADIMGLGRTTVGFILVALSTSLPELSVVVFSAADDDAVGVAVGNVLGSNIVNVCLILGLSILYASYKELRCIEFLPLITGDELKSLQFGLFIASLIPLTLMYIGYASRLIGVVLIAIFVYNTYQLSRRRTDVRDDGTPGKRRSRLLRYAVLTLLGAVGVIGSSYFIVNSASTIALTAGVPMVVIGATVVAFGTSIPELATSIQATRRDNIAMALANIIGSGFLNTTLILGAALAATELTVNMVAFTDIALFSLIANLFLWYFISGDRICWREGAVLAFLYVTFLVISFGGYRR